MPIQMSKSSARRSLNPTTLIREYMRSSVAQTPMEKSVHISTTGSPPPPPIEALGARWELGSAGGMSKPGGEC